ncbi:hypothetical protein [Longimicrobium sp.]|jgi:hypothetical protein|uniref:hypothetical protein n=1 Tax=Longimicrobium sp. TaxID=2029185 RepID=UPI002ED96C6A
MKEKKGKRPSSPFVDRGASKSPRSAFVGENRKNPRGGAPDYGGEFPLWAFRIVDLGGPWCWSALSGDALREVLQRMKEMETMTWHAITETGSHAIETARLGKPARDRLVEIQQDDADHVYSLRITGKRRIIGIREGGVLRVLWWDPEHQVCPAPRKHT